MVESAGDEIDIIGAPFAVLESDPGVFTALVRKLGIKGTEVEEVYDIEWSLNNLRPKGLILCFNWRNDSHHASDFHDPAAKDVWFANQLEDNACASLAILNIVNNRSDIIIGDELQGFKHETLQMSSKMKGLAISNSRLLREAQTSLARPADMRSSLNHLAQMSKEELEGKPRKPMKKRMRFDDQRAKANQKRRADLNAAETFHFIGYVPTHGKVWELDGLKAGPLEVGELPIPGSNEGWEDVVRPALRLKMEKNGAMDATASDIRFNLLALVEDAFEARSDDLRLAVKEKDALEDRLANLYGETWRDIDDDLLAEANGNLKELQHIVAPDEAFASDFGARWNTNKMEIIDLPDEELHRSWEACVRKVRQAKVSFDLEKDKATRTRVENAKRTYDYEPFIREILDVMHTEGLLADYITASKF